MNASTIKKALYLIVPVVLIALVVIKLKSNKEITEARVYQYDEQAAIHVVVDTLRPVVLDQGRGHLGNFEPYREVKIGAELPGKVKTIFVEEGSLVTQGQKLIDLDDALLRHQLKGVEVKIEGLEADVARFEILAAADAIQGVQLEKTQLALKGAKTEKATIEEKLRKATIRAPFAGIVTAKLTELGACAGPGMPLLQLTDIAQLKLTIHVSETDLPRFREGQAYPIHVRSFGDESFAGRLTMVGSKANMANSFPVKFLVQNTSNRQLKAGMFGEVRIVNNDAAPQIAVPASAVVRVDDKNSVYKVSNGKALRQNIEVAGRAADLVLVSSGLQAGDVIVTSGFTDLYDGANINLK